MIGHYRGMRALPSVLVPFIALSIACTSEASRLADEPQVASVEPIVQGPSTPSEASQPSERELASPDERPASPVITSDALEPAAAPSELPSASDPADSPAPIQPPQPAPGSPEADAELAELLDESTLTQEEFDAAFRGNGPKIEGDQFVFGPDERPRGRPIVDVGAASVSGSSVAPSMLADLVRASMRDLEGCHAMALGKDPSVAGAVTLALRFDAKGDVASAKIEGSSSLGAALDGCLVSVAKGWRLGAAKGATVQIPLKLSTTDK
jgi:hypothetical protein